MKRTDATAVAQVRVTEQARALINKNARAHNMSLSAYIMHASNVCEDIIGTERTKKVQLCTWAVSGCNHSAPKDYCITSTLLEEDYEKIRKRAHEAKVSIAGYIILAVDMCESYEQEQTEESNNSNDVGQRGEEHARKDNSRIHRNCRTL